jgi:ABC-type uncharacterized transport system involved in gliding motility auxiliary subunit
LRTLKYGSHASLFTLIVLAVLVIVYMVIVNHKQRFDVTGTQRFTLATQSLKLLRDLQQPIKVLGFFKREDRERTQFADLLKQYTHHTGQLTYELVDPDRQPAVAKQYNVTAYNTVVVAGNQRDEKVFRIEEEAITNALLKLTRGTKKVVYFVIGHGEGSITESERAGYSLAKKALEDQNYEVKDILLARQEQLPDDAAVVVIPGPRKPFLEPELHALTAYLERGGHLLLLLEPETTSGLETLVRQYGLELSEDMVIETNPLGRLLGSNELTPVVTAYEQHPITKELEGLMTIFPVVRSVSVAKELPATVTAQALASTSPTPQSWAETDLKTLQEQKQAAFDAEHDRPGPITIAAVATFTPPQPPAGEKDTPAAGQTTPTARSARLVVFGDAEFASNNFIPLQGNGDLFLNTVSWLAEEEDLIAIRPREGGSSGPVILTAAQQPLIFWPPVVLLPLAVFGLGALVLARRRWQQ